KTFIDKIDATLTSIQFHHRAIECWREWYKVASAMGLWSLIDLSYKKNINKNCDLSPMSEV
ncbi:MAG TPA: hypothetical protein VFK30_11550, partial [Anaerolineae bacterium]|nr:hypothetical protein [Anaerolineae bacterium]